MRCVVRSQCDQENNVFYVEKWLAPNIVPMPEREPVFKLLSGIPEEASRPVGPRVVVLHRVDRGGLDVRDDPQQGHPRDLPPRAVRGVSPLGRWHSSDNGTVRYQLSASKFRVVLNWSQLLQLLLIMFSLLLFSF